MMQGNKPPFKLEIENNPENFEKLLVILNYACNAVGKYATLVEILQEEAEEKGSVTVGKTFMNELVSRLDTHEHIAAMIEREFTQGVSIN